MILSLLLLLRLAATASLPADLTTVGVVVSATPERSVAVLRSGGRTRVVRVGDLAFGGRVLAIGPGVVTLDFGGARVESKLAAAAPAGAPTPTARPASAPAAVVAAEVGPPPKAMERREVERRLGQEMARILAETAVAPVTEDGHVSGLALTRIPDGSLLTEAGLRPGDVLTRINDTDIDGLGALIGLWPRLQSATELRATVLRNGQPVAIAITLR